MGDLDDLPLGRRVTEIRRPGGDFGRKLVHVAELLEELADSEIGYRDADAGSDAGHRASIPHQEREGRPASLPPA